MVTLIFALELAVFAIAAALCLTLAWFLGRLSRSWALLPLVWLGLALALAQVGIFQDPLAWQPGDVWRFLVFGTLMSLPLILGGLAWRQSAALRSAIHAVPARTLRTAQAYRIGGVLFLLLALQGEVPWALALWSGTLDIAIGLAALTPLSARRAWNYLGLADFGGAITLTGASFFGMLALSPAPTGLGFGALAAISLIQVPFAVATHLVLITRAP